MKKIISYQKIIIVLGVFMTLLTGGCKPTEKGYKAAYDAALNKREQAMVDYDPALPVEGLQSTDGPQLKEIEGSNYYFLKERLKKTEEDGEALHLYNVAVACYKMPTNCRAQVADLSGEGYPAFGAKSGEDKYYVILSSFPSLEEATECYRKYSSKKNRVYVGLPDSPVIIYSAK